ncbi:mannose-1-phosphate guanylyltransferase/mannose-6-phosphate isomerase [Pseudomaricurvus alkylphenolicus]|uniref:mannose-1-phosphate guanylyltransferase/mannose-6-phosphate isomerase n=1 Tax=Pseudomaricurvus alkylphenolicus TaxID=1306991 RepID=UPI00141EBC11|nr:mannose-1-phosphate guanylyltransferase/mannose-6-phosphate isomerase [Pseudomaricurvus alkylphenolicus]NIB44473.1 mannose-1-phosphate guanylyltransferase/mannose-6-phosphate isomerase [Pseudomaricurvus alkylphenolicus]
MIVPVVMAGGSGTRLWPMSRSLYPKQFLPLVNQTSMLQDTCARLDGMESAAPLVICGEDHRFTVAEQLRELDARQAGRIVLEPAGRNTAPAVALAALQATAGGDNDPLLLVLAADHVITDVSAFQTSVEAAIAHAQTGKLVTFGIVPTGPETGYGYIRQGEDLGGAYRVAEFVEKPNLETAEKYLASGDFAWNSGMFLFKAGRYLEELKAHRPDILAACQEAMAQASVDADFVRPDKDAFLNCPDDSIDYAVMEKTSDAVVVPMDCGWSDVGSWSALWEVSPKDGNGNALRGDIITYDTHNCFVRSDSKLVATVGLKDIVVVESDDAIMVAAKDRVQEVKRIVEALKKESRSEAQLHRKVYRPWGFYDSIDNGERFQVKRIVVKPGGKLSLQMHHHRAEHWIVVSGTAKVTRGEETFLVSENESTYIPLGVKHRLENPGTIALEMIEVQSGSYLGEDDIVRFEDTYGRG